MRLTREQTKISGVRRMAVLAACAALGAGACGSAPAFAVHVDEAASATAKKAASHPLSVPSGVMAGHIVSRVNPKYPEAAKKAKVQGPVVLDALIGTDGTVQQLRAASGPQELRASALEAVRQWVYQPFLLNGNPVEVETTITVTYSLAP